LSSGRTPEGAAARTGEPATGNLVGYIQSGDAGSYLGFTDSGTATGSVYVGADSNNLRLRWQAELHLYSQANFVSTIGNTAHASTTSYSYQLHHAAGSNAAPTYSYVGRTTSGHWFDNATERLYTTVSGTAIAYASTTSLHAISGLYENNTKVTQSIIPDRAEYLNAQPYIENGVFEAAVPRIGGSGPAAYVQDIATEMPFSKVMRFDSYAEYRSDFLPVQAGETIYGEIWAMRETGATGTSGGLYFGVARYDKDQLPIATNSAIAYFVCGNAAVPNTSTRTK